MTSKEQSIIFYAFRYALGRMTYAVGEVVEHLEEKWDELDGETQLRIQTEIREAISREQAGTAFDEECWRVVLKLKRKQV